MVFDFNWDLPESEEKKYAPKRTQEPKQDLYSTLVSVEQDNQFITRYTIIETDLERGKRTTILDSRHGTILNETKTKN